MPERVAVPQLLNEEIAVKISLNNQEARLHIVLNSSLNYTLGICLPCCSTILILTQNKGMESENSYKKLKRSQWTDTRTHTRKQNQNILADTAIFLNQKRVNICDHDKGGININ